MTIYITDTKECKELHLVPEWTNNTWSTEDEIESWNNGYQESAGFHWNDEADRWECTEENYEWWQELAEARRDLHAWCYAQKQEDVAAAELYNKFMAWFKKDHASELEDEKRVMDYIDTFEQSTKYYIRARRTDIGGDTEEWTVGYDNEPTDDFENRMFFSTREQAEEWTKSSEAAEWKGCSFEIVEPEL